MTSYFGYTRVSTVKQGERGVSLQEQHEAITRYAARAGLSISSWFEERETAAKRGRPVFNAMLRLLRQGKVRGVIIHKIDRSARNLRDWADLGELIDHGVEVHFANESLDLHSRGGRLSADIQAVVAADFIRNLREETRKGFYGRLKQGLYPLPAPLGYRDCGKGKAKEPDPVAAPLVRTAFELYGSGRYSLDVLVTDLSRRGLRNRHGQPVTRNGLSVLLNNPFYLGLVRIRRTGETFSGSHQPLVTKRLFDQVQQVLRGKTPHRTVTHQFVFRRLFRCRHCAYALIGERQKGHAYYRCHTKDCPTTGLREELIDSAIRRAFVPLQLSDLERRYLASKMSAFREHWRQQRASQEAALRLCLAQSQARLARLTDAYLDGTIEKSLFEERKTALLMERRSVEDQLLPPGGAADSVPDRLAKFLELAANAHSTYEKAPFPEDRRDLLCTVTSNRQVAGKTLVVELSEPFREIGNRFQYAYGDPQRDIPRTWNNLLPKLANWFLFAGQSHDARHRRIVRYLDKEEELAA